MRATALALIFGLVVTGQAVAQQKKPKGENTSSNACTWDKCVKLQTSRGWESGEAGQWCQRHMTRGDACQ